MSDGPRVLIVDDDPDFLNATQTVVQSMGCQVATADSLQSALAIIDQESVQHILLDLMLPDGNGLHLLPSLESRGLDDIGVTIITGHPAIRNSIKNLHGPNIGYLMKPITRNQLRKVLDCPDDDSGSQESDFQKHFGTLIGESSAMHKVYEAIERVADSSARVLLLGESGVGKELVANAIHNRSGRKGKFVPANCGAFNNELIGSELFGHEKGAYTGATSRRIGLFEQAVNGTLMLDEITEMPLALQPILLRVLESESLVRLGGTNSIDVDCRVISATNQEEHAILDGGCLRKDLYYRLAVFPIDVPPLRQRKEDIPLLARFFLEELNKEYKSSVRCDESFLEQLQRYDWPGNVRELRHAIHRSYILSDRSEESRLVAPNVHSLEGEQGGTSLRAGQSLEEVEKILIGITLEEFNNDKKATAKALGISLKTLYNRLNAYDQGKNDGGGES